VPIRKNRVICVLKKKIMLGWNIFINRENGEWVASWLANVGGLQWLNVLAEAGHVYFGKSEQVIAACLPNEYLTVEVWDLS
jgi:hypothetical protein